MRSAGNKNITLQCRHCMLICRTRPFFPIVAMFPVLTSPTKLKHGQQAAQRPTSIPDTTCLAPVIHKLQKVFVIRSANFTFLQVISFHRESPHFTSITVCSNWDII